MYIGAGSMGQSKTAKGLAASMKLNKKKTAVEAQFVNRRSTDSPQTQHHDEEEEHEEEHTRPPYDKENQPLRKYLRKYGNVEEKVKTLKLHHDTYLMVKEDKPDKDAIVVSVISSQTCKPANSTLISNSISFRVFYRRVWCLRLLSAARR